MNLKECYQALGGDYEGVLGRLRSERLVTKFVMKFPAEKSFEELVAAIGAKDGEVAFRAAHTIKGNCLNLGFDRLFASSNAMSECLRGGWNDAATALLPQVEEDYRVTVEAIGQLEA